MQGEMMTIEFFLSIKEMSRVSEFMENHECGLEVDEDGGKNVGAIGGRATYSFTPTSLGVIQTVSCACGKKLSLTNFDEW